MSAGHGKGENDVDLYCHVCGEFLVSVSGSAPPVPVRHRSCNGSVNPVALPVRNVRSSVTVGTHEH